MEERKSAKILLREIADDAYQRAWDAKNAGEKIGWCASNFPVEIPAALGIQVVYPENQAAAIAAKEEGAEKVLILERDNALGGILQQCIHPGFGLTRFKEELTGPEYYERFVDKAREVGVEYMLNSMVLEVNHDAGEILCTSSQFGMTAVQAKSIVLAMGCRERTRAGIMVPGTRPAGLYTAGSAQRLVN